MHDPVRHPEVPYPETRFVNLPDYIPHIPRFAYDEKGRSEEHAWRKANADRYYNTHEGGTEVWLLVPGNWSKLNCASEGRLTFSGPSVVSNDGVALAARRGRGRSGDVIFDRDVHAAALLLSTGLSLAKVGSGEYWVATYEDLTFEGRELFGVFRRAYATRPVIVTLLDT